MAAHAAGAHAKEAEDGVEKLEPYEKASSGLGFMLQSAGRIEWDNNGVMHGGPVTVSFGGHAIRLANPMIQNSVISTVDYGKLQIKPGGGFSVELYLKPSSQKKLKALVAGR